MRVWRLTHRRHAHDAFSGEGNRLVGSRWVPRGIPAVYTSGSSSGAVLETLVHLDVPQLRNNFVLFPVDIPEAVEVIELPRESLPAGWNEIPAPAFLQLIGGAWNEAGESAVLGVPSVLVPAELNYILNPAHPDVGKIRVGEPDPFVFDGRLVPRERHKESE